jgi:hypothetical protein
MDELTFLRSIIPDAPTADEVERSRARTVLSDHIARQGSRQGAAGKALALPRLRGIIRSRSTRAVGLALAGLLIAGSVSLVGAIRYFGEWGGVDHPATVAQVDAEIAEAIASTALPPGYTYPVAAIRASAESDAVRAQLVGAHAVSWHAMCAWTSYWLGAYRAGDGPRMAAALPVIEEFPHWLIADPRFADDSIRNELASVVAGARAGDGAPLETLYEAAGCEELLAR